MSNISAKQVKELRDATNISMMECKKALVESDGDFDGALKVLKERGLAVAGKRAGKDANEGIVCVKESERGAFMISVSCETDFVANSDDFKYLADTLMNGYAKDGNEYLEKSETKDLISDTIAKCGEKIVVSNKVFFLKEDLLKIGSYVHANKKIGVLVTLETDGQGDEINQLAKDIAMQIAAMNPISISQSDVSQEMKNEQTELFRKQLEEEGKPKDMIEKILIGKVNKYFSDYCLEDMYFIKDDKIKIKNLIADVKKKNDLDNLLIRKYKRFQIGQ